MTTSLFTICQRSLYHTPTTHHPHHASNNHPTPSIDLSSNHHPFIRSITLNKPPLSFPLRHTNRSNPSRPLPRRCIFPKLSISNRSIPPRPHQTIKPLDPKSRSIRNDRESLEVGSEEKEGFKAEIFSCEIKGYAGSL